MDIGICYNIFDKRFSRYGEDRYKKIREYGYKYIDFSFADTNSKFYTLPEGEAISLLKKEKALMDEAGIKVSQVHGPWRWPALDYTEEDREERMEKMQKSIRLMRVLDCDNFVIHPIMPFGVNEVNTPDAEKTWKLNLEFMRKLLGYAKEYDVYVCLENMPMLEFSISEPRDILRFVKEINDEHFKICLDTGHVGVFLKGISPAQAIREMGSEIRTLHIHDNQKGYDMHNFPRVGILDWDDIAKALKETGYKGVFSSESFLPFNVSDKAFDAMCIAHYEILNDIVNR